MAQKTFNINATEVVEYTNRLEKLSRSALPIAIRSTLNDASFDMKKNTIPQSFEKTFTIRQPGLIQRFTTVEPIRSELDIKKMHSNVGLVDRKNRKKSGETLPQLDTGGTLNDRKYIPFETARGGDNSQKVTKDFWLNKIKKNPNLVNIKKRGKLSQNQEFIRAAFKSGVNGFIVYNNIIYRIIELKKTPQLNIRTEALYLGYEESLSPNIKARPFMNTARKNTTEKMNEFFIKNAKFRFEKALKK